MRKIVLWLPALLCAGSVSIAQDDAETTFKTDVKVVNVLANVFTKKGAIIRDLTKDDFTVAENGRPQTIRYFSRESDLPLTLGLMVDTSMSQRRVLEAERAASFRFLDQVLRENKDQVFIMQFDMAVMMSQPLTSSRKKLDEALSFVDTPSLHELQSQGTSGGTLLYDAVVNASQEVMANLHGRKALIVLSDGVDIGSEANLTAAVEAAQRADTLIYSILFSDSGAYGIPLALMPGPDGRGALQRLSKDTGGGFFEVSKKHPIQQIFDIIQDELRSQYNMGYVSDVPVRISEFRKIQVAMRQKGLVVQARDRYWAQR
ncbi:MAG: VWA domain-containing protein [Bryobacteraceae bacterium]